MVLIVQQIDTFHVETVEIRITDTISIRFSHQFAE